MPMGVAGVNRSVHRRAYYGAAAAARRSRRRNLLWPAVRLPVPKVSRSTSVQKSVPQASYGYTPKLFLYAVVEPNQIGRIGMAAFDNYTHSWLGLTLAPMRRL